MVESVKYNKYLDSSGVVFEKIPLNKMLIYSSEEQKVGKWVDGKDLYRKIFSIGGLPNDQTITIPHKIDNFYQLIDLRSKWYDSRDKRWRVQSRTDNSEIKINFAVDTDNLIITAIGTDWSIRTEECTVSVFYTKDNT